MKKVITLRRGDVESIEFPETVISMSVEPVSSADRSRLSQALATLAREDPTFIYRYDQQTSQTIMSGMGELHLQVLHRKLAEDLKVPVRVGNPLVAYRKEAFEMYEGLLARVQESVARSALLPILVVQQRPRRLRTTRPGMPRQTGRRAVQQRARPAADQPKQPLGRNDPCWCGSGRKYKQCHMRQDQGQQGPVVTPKPSGGTRRKRRRRR